MKLERKLKLDYKRQFKFLCHSSYQDRSTFSESIPKRHLSLILTKNILKFDSEN